MQLDNGASVDGPVENNGTLQFNTTLPISVAAGNVISGAGAVQVTNSGTVTLSVANLYGGATAISNGRLSLSGGDNRLPTTTTLSISGGSLDVGTNSQSVTNFTATGGTIVGSGTLAVSAATGGVQNVTMTNLSTFLYDAGTATVTIGGQAFGQTGTVALASGRNVLRAGLIQLPVFQNGGGAATAGTLRFGEDNTLHADSIRVGYGTRTFGTAEFATGLTNPSLTIRGQDGTARSQLAVGVVVNNTVHNTGGTFDTQAGTLDALVSTLVVGESNNINTGGAFG